MSVKVTIEFDSKLLERFLGNETYQGQVRSSQYCPPQYYPPQYYPPQQYYQFEAPIFKSSPVNPSPPSHCQCSYGDTQGRQYLHNDVINRPPQETKNVTSIIKNLVGENGDTVSDFIYQIAMGLKDQIKLDNDVEKKEDGKMNITLKPETKIKEKSVDKNNNNNDNLENNFIIISECICGISLQNGHPHS